MDDEDMARYPGLQTRDGTWYVRKRVPADLKHIDRRGSVRLSLETSDLREAKRRYPLKLAEITVGFDKIRAELRERGSVGAALARGRLEDLARAEIEQLVAKWWGVRWRTPEIDEHADPKEIASCYDDDAARAAGAAPNVADQLLVEEGMASYPLKVRSIQTATTYPAVDRTTASYRYLVDLVARALRIEAQMSKDDLLGTADAPYDRLFNPKGAGPSSDQPESTTADLITAYRTERETVFGKESTERKYGLLFRVMEEVLGPGLPVKSINRARTVQVLEFLKKLPPNATKRFPKLTLSQAVAHGQVKELPGLAPGTIASYMQGLNAILGWAEREGWGVRLHSKGLLPPPKAKVRRRGFRPEELQKLFAALAPFRKTDPTKYWVSALALYTGARAGEICQLLAEDVVSIDSIWCLDLSEFDAEGQRVEGKRLKTLESERYIPLHPHLIDAGFLDFVRSRSKRRLFPDLEPGPKESYSHNFSKWFGRFKRKAGFREPALVFHSFRHGFRDACRDADIPDEIALALGGWAGTNQAARYGNRGAVQNLHRAVVKIGFGNFTLGAVEGQEPHSASPKPRPMSEDFATGCSESGA